VGQLCYPTGFPLAVLHLPTCALHRHRQAQYCPEPRRDRHGPDGTSLEAQTGARAVRRSHDVDPSSAQALHARRIRAVCVGSWRNSVARGAEQRATPHKATAHVKRSSTTPPGHTRSACPKRSGGASSPKATGPDAHVIERPATARGRQRPVRRA
jgi:hypothetical protein